MGSGYGPRATAGSKGGHTPTHRRRRREVTDAEALAIRDRTMLEMRALDGLDDTGIAKVFGLGERSVREGIRRARAAIGRWADGPIAGSDNHAAGPQDQPCVVAGRCG